MGIDHAPLEAVQRACRYIEAQEGPVTLATLGRQVGYSAFHLQRTFKQIMGITPQQYSDACRLRRFKGALRDGESVSSAIAGAGYGSSSRLYERSERIGMPPAAYRRGGAGREIRYTIVSSPLGRLLVGGTERGLCAVSLGESDAELEDALAREYPAADRQRDDAALAPWVASLLRHLAGSEPHLELPLDVRATAFQERVWQALQAIPYGETRTYRQIAQELGRPGAARAVARACATNPVSIVIPCHRVVREDGNLAGYRWGVERKRTLQELEARHEQALDVSDSPRSHPDE